MAELHSKVHSRVRFTDQGGQEHELGLPITIGEEPYQCPRHVATALVSMASSADEYVISTDPAPPSEQQPQATQQAARATTARQPKASKKATTNGRT